MLCNKSHVKKNYLFAVYDYGTFGFWGALLAGGHTMVADNWSKKLHYTVQGIRKVQPANWTLVDVKKIDKK